MDVLDDDLDMLDDDEIIGEFDDNGINGESKFEQCNDEKEMNFVPHEYFEEKDFRSLDIDEIKKIEFKTLAEAGRFYLTYAKGMGFSIRKNSSHSSKVRPIINGKSWVCSKEGVRREQWFKYEDRKRPPKDLSRERCKAAMLVRLNLNTMLWRISTFRVEHNHELAPPAHKLFLHSHRHVDDGSLKEAMAMKASGIRGCEAMKHLANKVGGAHKLGFIRKDLYNSMRMVSRSRIVEGDANAVLLYLERQKISDPSLVYRVSSDEENRLEKLFWTDAKAKMDFRVFGDVIVFDTTYKKNAYNMPLLSIVGVNNHSQTLVFGFAMLSNERVESFIWVLEEFVSAMGNKRPLSVVTDGDKAMQNAIEVVLPDARHRLCVWHLARNARSNVPNSNFVKAFSRCMLRWCTRDEFDEAWREMVNKYGLHDNEWVIEKWNTRHRWAQAYLTGHFFATVKSTSRCEGLNSYLKRYTKHSGTLLEFVEQLSLAVNNIRSLEVEADFRACYTRPVLTIAGLELIEGHAARVFTRNAFKRVRKELNHQYLYSVAPDGYKCSEDGTTVTYTVQRYMNGDKVTTVIYNQDEQRFSCSCKKFESEGIPCRHVFHVMIVRHNTNIPDSLINRRWTIGVREEFMSCLEPQFSANEAEFFRHASLRTRWNSVLGLASKSKEGYDLANKWMSNLATRIHAVARGDRATDNNVVLEDRVADPQRVKSKGRSKNNSRAEENVKGNKKGRCCRGCGGNGHDMRNCPGKNTIGKKRKRSHRDGDNVSDHTDDELKETGFNLAKFVVEHNRDDAVDNGINKTYGEAAPVSETEYDSSDGELFGDVGDYSDFEMSFQKSRSSDNGQHPLGETDGVPSTHAYYSEDDLFDVDPSPENDANDAHGRDGGVQPALNKHDSNNSPDLVGGPCFDLNKDPDIGDEK